MKDNDIDYVIGGYSILEVVAAGLIGIVSGTVRFIVRMVKGAYELAVDLKDRIADIKPQLIPQRRSSRPVALVRGSALAELMKFRSGIF